MAEVLAFKRPIYKRENIREAPYGDRAVNEMRKDLPFLSDRGPLVNIRLVHVFGLVPAILLSEIDYQVKCTELGVPHDGEIWVGLTYKDLESEIGSIWGSSTIRRSISELREMGALWSKHLSSFKQDRTNYYAIDYDKVYDLCKQVYGEDAMRGQ